MSAQVLLPAVREVPALAKVRLACPFMKGAAQHLALPGVDLPSMSPVQAGARRAERERKGERGEKEKRRRKTSITQRYY